MKLEILPHQWVNKLGSKCAAEYYPYIDGNPAPEIATCKACMFYNTNLKEGYCDAWRDEPENAPWFCGPICNKFTLAKGTDDGLPRKL